MKDIDWDNLNVKNGKAYILKEYSDKGSVGLYVFEDFCLISDLKVHEACRKQGIGKDLLRKAIVMACAEGNKPILLEVEKGSWMSYWYRREGFGYYADSSRKGKEFLYYFGID